MISIHSDSMVLLIAQYSPSAHEESYSQKGKNLMLDAAETATADEDRAHGFDEVAYGVNIRGEIGSGRHGTCRREKTRKQEEYHDEEPHHEDGLLHGVGVIGYYQSE